MTPAVLLDHWQPPEDAGVPVGLVATTFAFEPDFFETDCLARFLSVTAVDEGSDSVVDHIGRIELTERLAGVPVCILADRSADAKRSQLGWDLLTCRVGRAGALLHSKVTVLLWENATRVLIGSANLTSAGYRRQLEIGLAADLGDGCLLPRSELLALADEVESYLGLVPGMRPDQPARQRAMRLLGAFRDRARDSTARPPSNVRVALAPTNDRTSPLQVWPDVWGGGKPLTATQLSPFWSDEAIGEVGALLARRPAADRRHVVVFGSTPDGLPQRPGHLPEADGTTQQMVTQSDDYRTLHAKALVLRSADWVAALVGSSNHTVAGLGLGEQRRPVRHRELNVWIGAPSKSATGRALLDLIPADVRAADGLEPAAETDEDEDPVLALPDGFGLAELTKRGDFWSLALTFEPARVPPSWAVTSPIGTELLTSTQWTALGRPATWSVGREANELDSHLMVRLPEGDTVWPVLVEAPTDLPLPLSIADLKAADLLEALRRRISLSTYLESQAGDNGTGVSAAELDPLRRFDDPTALLRRGRVASEAFEGMTRRLRAPVLSVAALRARLHGPLGPVHVCRKLVEESRARSEPNPEAATWAAFSIAEILLCMSRVDWRTTVRLEHVEDALVTVAEAVELIRTAAQALDGSADVTRYLADAREETLRCLAG